MASASSVSAPASSRGWAATSSRCGTAVRRYGGTGDACSARACACDSGGAEHNCNGQMQEGGGGRLVDMRTYLGGRGQSQLTLLWHRVPHTALVLLAGGGSSLALATAVQLQPRRRRQAACPCACPPAHPPSPISPTARPQLPPAIALLRAAPARARRHRTCQTTRRSSRCVWGGGLHVSRHLHLCGITARVGTCGHVHGPAWLCMHAQWPEQWTKVVSALLALARACLGACLPGPPPQPQPQALAAAGADAKRFGHRLTFHPSHFTTLASQK